MTFEILKERWEAGLISRAMLLLYVRKGVITMEQFNEIVGE